MGRTSRAVANLRDMPAEELLEHYCWLRLAGESVGNAKYDRG